MLIGVGLIGGSFMLDLKRLGLVQTVTGIDTNTDNLNYALLEPLKLQIKNSLKPIIKMAEEMPFAMLSGAV